MSYFPFLTRRRDNIAIVHLILVLHTVGAGAIVVIYECLSYKLNWYFRCVMKMDHHCPWINTCCGHFNHANFVWFLLIAPLGCVHAGVVLIISTYKALNWVSSGWIPKFIHLKIYLNGITYTKLYRWITTLLYMHISSVSKNEGNNFNWFCELWWSS